jgi:hypothetical protein
MLTTTYGSQIDRVNKMNANNIPISNAIRKLTSTIKWSVVDDYDMSTLEWNDTEVTRPRDVEIQAMRQQMANEQNTIEYIKLRTEGQYEPITDSNGERVLEKVTDGYPSIEHQLDLLYHDIKSGNLESGNWIAAIESVKQQFPKPE